LMKLLLHTPFRVSYFGTKDFRTSYICGYIRSAFNGYAFSELRTPSGMSWDCFSRYLSIYASYRCDSNWSLTYLS